MNGCFWPFSACIARQRSVPAWRYHASLKHAENCRYLHRAVNTVGSINSRLCQQSHVVGRIRHIYHHPVGRLRLLWIEHAPASAYTHLSRKRVLSAKLLRGSHDVGGHRLLDGVPSAVYRTCGYNRSPASADRAHPAPDKACRSTPSPSSRSQC